LVAVTFARPSKTISLQPRDGKCYVGLKPATISIVASGINFKASECAANCVQNKMMQYPTHPYTVANSLTMQLRRRLIEDYGKGIPTSSNAYHFNALRVGNTFDIKVGLTKVISKEDSAFGWHPSVHSNFKKSGYVAAVIYKMAGSNRAAVDLGELTNMAKCLCEEVID